MACASPRSEDPSRRSAPSRTARFAALLRFVLATLAVAPHPAAEAPAAEAPAVDAAETTLQAGYAAMQAADADHPRIVEAALAFTAALSRFEALGRLDRVQELHADIFWCKKRMTDADLDAYCAAKGLDVAAAPTVVRMKEVADAAVPADQADAYAARARAFAEAHPDDAMAVTVRWFEVAERFPGTPAGIEAQKRSLEAQKAWLSAERAGMARQVEQRAADSRRDTLFAHGATAAAAGLPPLPAEADWRRQQPAARKLFKDAARTTRREKAALAATILEQAKGTGDDAALQYAMFQEAESLAVDLGDPALGIAIVDAVCATFGEGSSRLEEAQRVLGAMTGCDAAAAALTLLKDPLDANANTRAGRHWCLIAQQWEVGLPMLAAGDDAKLAHAASMEIAKPATALQQAELADAWFAIARAAPRGCQAGAYDRARTWYKTCEPTLTGAAHLRVVERLDELFGLRPDPDADYNHLTEKQWDALKGQVVDVDAVRNACDGHVALRAGQTVRIVPHPTDTWQGARGARSNGNQPPSYRWDGDSPGAKATPAPVGKAAAARARRAAKAMSLVCWVDDEHGQVSARQQPGILQGPGEIWLACATPGAASSGRIRVKLLPLDDGSD